MAQTPGTAQASRRIRSTRRSAFGLLAALLVQFGLGMWVNLFSHIPLQHPGHGAGNFFRGVFDSVTWADTSKQAPVVLAVHAGLGLLLVLASVVLAIQGVRTRRPAAGTAAVLTALFVLGAGFNGGSFLNYNKDLNSYLMAMLFAGAVLCCGLILVLPAGTGRNAPASGD
jgi:hypothetical protein